jgi:hypothetical protein
MPALSYLPLLFAEVAKRQMLFAFAKATGTTALHAGQCTDFLDSLD